MILSKSIRFVVSLVGFFSLLPVNPTFAQQLVANGDFETGNFSGWTSSGNLAGTSVTTNQAYVNDGTYAAQLGPAGNPGFLSQNLATVAGQTYELSLWLNSPDGETPNEFRVSWNGVVIFDAVNLAAIGWTNLVFTNLAASSSSTALQIGFRDDPTYFGLDDVSVTPPDVPIPLVTPPGNDNFSSALAMTLPAYQFAANGPGATRENGEPDHGSPVDDGDGLVDPGGEGNSSLWWTFDSTQSGVMDISISQAAFTPLIAVYTGTVVSNLSLVVSSTTAWGVPGAEQDIVATNVHFTVAANVRYHIAVDGYSQGKGAFTVNSQFTGPPANDNFASHPLLSATFVNITGSNIAATLETGEPVHTSTAGGASASVWWSWTPNFAGPVILTTAGSAFDTVLDVFTGTLVNSLTLVSSNDNAATFTNTLGPTFDPLSRVAFTAKAGTAYQLCVSGVSGATGAIILNNLSVAITNIVSSAGKSNSDGTLAFTNVLKLSNLRATVTNPLRVSLWAKPGYQYQEHLDTDYQLINSFNVPQQEIGLTNIPGLGVLASQASSNLTVSGICPAPFYYTNFPAVGGPEIVGIGYTVLANLEEDVAGVWVTRDSRTIIVGNWPVINDFIGPAGGVVTLASTMSGTPQTPTFLQINFGPPAAMRLGGLWRFSPTNDGANGEFRFYTNFINKTNLTLLVNSTNFSVEMTNLPGFSVSTNSLVTYAPGTIVPLNLFYSVAQPRLIFNPAQGLGLTGTTGTAYEIDTTTNPTVSNWTFFANKTLATGTNFVSNTGLNSKSNRFYRAFWLPN